MKVVQDDQAFEQFAIFCHDKKPVNSLFPQVYEYFYLADRSFCCIVERIIPLLKFGDAYQVEDLVENLSMGEEIPDNYQMLMKNLKFNNKQLAQFIEIVRSFGKDDIQVNNMGRRKDGSLVIFDPVKP